MTTAAIPPLLADLGAGAGALAAIIGLIILVYGVINRGFHRGSNMLREVIREETLTPAQTRELVRTEVDRALEPHAAQLRTELRTIVAEMRPNGGSSLRDQVDRLTGEMRSVQSGQRKIFAHLGSDHGSLADADDPDDTSGET